MRRLDALMCSIMAASDEEDATDLELLIVVTRLQNRLLTIANDPALRAVIGALIRTEDRQARAVMLLDVLDVCRESPTVH